MSNNLSNDKVFNYVFILSSILFFLYIVIISFSLLFKLLKLLNQFESISLILFFTILYFHFVILVILTGLSQAIKLFIIFNNKDNMSYYKQKGSFLSNPPLQGIGIITFILGTSVTIYVIININKFNYINEIYHIIIYILGVFILLSFTCISIERLLFHIKNLLIYKNN
jgi:hypothetical protein